jgi:hypothetical protein
MAAYSGPMDLDLPKQSEVSTLEISQEMSGSIRFDESPQPMSGSYTGSSITRTGAAVGVVGFGVFALGGLAVLLLVLGAVAAFKWGPWGTAGATGPAATVGAVQPAPIEIPAPGVAEEVAPAVVPEPEAAAEPAPVEAPAKEPAREVRKEAPPEAGEGTAGGGPGALAAGSGEMAAPEPDPEPKVVLVAAPPEPAAPVKVEMGKLQIQCTKADLRIFIDGVDSGKRTGTTGFTLPLAAGKHSLRFDGFEAQELEIKNKWDTKSAGCE